MGAKTFKLKFGHRGINHPVNNLTHNNVEITSQNHGFAVDLNTLPNNVKSTHINLNDQTSAELNAQTIKRFQFNIIQSPALDLMIADIYLKNLPK